MSTQDMGLPKGADALRTGFRIERRRRLPLAYWMLGALAVAFVATFLLERRADPSEVLRAAIGAAAAALGSLTFFLYKQQLDETRLFLELFRNFNATFDGLNDGLNALTARLAKEPDVAMSAGERQLLFDYFNLCAEEHLCARAGYIDRGVWGSWLRGMRSYADVPAIRRLWEQELAAGSYYGFSLDLCAEVD